jgi:hypothetical protein
MKKENVLYLLNIRLLICYSRQNVNVHNSKINKIECLYRKLFTYYSNAATLKNATQLPATSTVCFYGVKIKKNNKNSNNKNNQ